MVNGEENTVGFKRSAKIKTRKRKGKVAIIK
jgi:hypothetical protein